MSQLDQSQQGQQSQTQGPDLVAVALGVALVAIAIALTLPVIAVAAVAAVALRGRGAATRAKVAAAGAALGGIVALAWPGWQAALADYRRPYRQVLAHLEHQVPLRLSAGDVLGTLLLAVPVGLATAPLALGALSRKAAKKRGGSSQALSEAPKAQLKKLRPLVVPRRHVPGDRVPLGLLDGRLLMALREWHVCVVAPTRSGKTRGVVVPALLTWRGPVVATSTKADLLWDPQHKSGTYAWRARQGEVFVYDPSGSSGWGSVRWSPLGRATDWQAALRAAYAMVAAEQGGAEESSTSRFFAGRAAQALAPALHACALAGCGMREVLKLVRKASSLAGLADDLEEALSAGGACAEALSALDALRVGSETSSGDTLATLANVLAAYDDPVVARNSDECTLKMEDVFLGDNTLYIVSGPDSKRLASLYACLLDELFSCVQAWALRHGPLSPRLLLALDEVATIAPIERLPQLLATCSGWGANVLMAFQNLGQMRSGWGRSGPSAILGNSAAQLFAATSDPDTAEHLSRVLGRQLVQTQSVTADLRNSWFAQAEQAKSVSTSWAERSVLDSSALRLLEGGPLLVAQGLPPTVLAWNYHDQAPLLRRRSSLAPGMPLQGPGKPAADPADWLAAYRG